MATSVEIGVSRAADVSQGGGVASAGSISVDKMMERYLELQAKLSAVEAQVSSLSMTISIFKDYGGIIVGILFVIVAIIVYFSGKSFSDLRKDTIDIVSAKASAAVDEKYKSYGDKIDKIKDINDEAQRRKDQYEALDANIKSMLLGFSAAESIGNDFGGLLATYQADYEKRSVATQMYSTGLPVSVEETTLEPKWRATVKAMLTRLADTMPDGSIDPNTYFNAATLASSLDFDALAATLAQHAVSADPSISHVARSLRTIHAKGGNDAQAAFDDILNIVRDLPIENPQIILSEAWNTAERSRMHAKLIEAIDCRIAKGDVPEYVPSYAFVMKARALLRKGDPESANSAREVLALAEERLRRESPEATWFDSSLNEGKQVAKILAKLDAGANISFAAADSNDDREDFMDPAIAREAFRHIFGRNPDRESVDEA